MKAIFLALFLSIFAIILFYAKKRFFDKIDFANSTKKYMKLFLIALYLLVLLYFSNRFFNFLPSWLYYIASLSIAFGFIIFIFAIFYEIFKFMSSSLRLTSNKTRIVEFSIFYLMILYLGFGIVNGFSDIQIKNYKIKSSKLKSDIRIVFFSDLHIGPLVDWQYTRKLVELINAQNPDFIIIGGDLIDDNLYSIKPQVAELKKLKASKRVLYAIGNHEYFYGENDVLNLAKTLNFEILDNKSFFDSELVIQISGIFDYFGNRKNSLKPDLYKLHNNNDFYRVLVSHQPKVLSDKLLDKDKFELILSGHTHCGQIFPFGFLVLLDQPYLCGKYEITPKLDLVVSSGAGFWGPRVRIGSDFEIVMIDLIGDKSQNTK
jgi:predicted MPP superfamily phosphohydrolase